MPGTPGREHRPAGIPTTPGSSRDGGEPLDLRPAVGGCMGIAGAGQAPLRSMAAGDAGRCCPSLTLTFPSPHPLLTSHHPRPSSRSQPPVPLSCPLPGMFVYRDLGPAAPFCPHPLLHHAGLLKARTGLGPPAWGHRPGTWAVCRGATRWQRWRRWWWRRRHRRRDRDRALLPSLRFATTTCLALGPGGPPSDIPSEDQLLPHQTFSVQLSVGPRARHPRPGPRGWGPRGPAGCGRPGLSVPGGGQNPRREAAQQGDGL